MNLLSAPWALYLGLALAWTTLFSLSSRPSIRGLRNIGILASYLAAILMFVRLPWRSALATWAAYAIVASVLYFAYEMLSYARSAEKESKPRVTTLFFAFVAWPIMLPEAVEYSLADLTLLKLPKSSGSTPPGEDRDAS